MKANGGGIVAEHEAPASHRARTRRRRSGRGRVPRAADRAAAISANVYVMECDGPA